MVFLGKEVCYWATVPYRPTFSREFVVQQRLEMRRNRPEATNAGKNHNRSRLQLASLTHEMKALG